MNPHWKDPSIRNEDQFIPSFRDLGEDICCGKAYIEFSSVGNCPMSILVTEGKATIARDDIQDMLSRFSKGELRIADSTKP